MEILNAYGVDFAKHAPSTIVMRINEVWHSIPSQLARENKKFAYKVIKESARGRQYENAIQWLVDAGLIHKIFNVTTPNLPLAAYSEVDAFKLYLLDVGLLGAMAEISPKLLIEGNTLFTHFKGAFIENYVATALKPYMNRLHYWTSAGKAELDFLIQHEDEIIPIEVKSGSTRQKKSLRAYIEKYHPSHALIASPANLILDGNILNCPLYMTDLLMDKILALL